MKTRELDQYTIPAGMRKYDLGVGVVTVYQLNNNKRYLVMGEYHNKGALSPTVGSRFSAEEGMSLHQSLSAAFYRKRLGVLSFNDGLLDKKHAYYALNQDQGFARVTFIHQVALDMSEEAFTKEVIVPMHTEAQHQGQVSSFFWKLDETLNPNKSNSKFKFKTHEDLMAAAKVALQAVHSSRFPVTPPIIDKLKALQDEDYIWDDAALPLAFYEKHGGRKYSELTGFYLISLNDLIPQFIHPNIKADRQKPTIFIQHPTLPSEPSWKKFFIFEDEIKTIAEIINFLAGNRLPNEASALPSPWSVDKITMYMLPDAHRTPAQKDDDDPMMAWFKRSNPADPDLHPIQLDDTTTIADGIVCAIRSGNKLIGQINIGNRIFTDDAVKLLGNGKYRISSASDFYSQSQLSFLAGLGGASTSPSTTNTVRAMIDWTVYQGNEIIVDKEKVYVDGQCMTEKEQMSAKPSHS